MNLKRRRTAVKVHCPPFPRVFAVAACIALLSGCASQPKPAETVWATVVTVYSTEELMRSHNAGMLERFRSAGFSRQDIGKGRLLRVACGLGSDHTWGSYAYLPPGLNARKDDVVRLKIDDPGTDDRMGMNPALNRVEWFKWPGSTQAYRYIPDWKEKNLFYNFERIALEPGQQDRYIISHGSYVIKCRQADEPE